MTRLRTVSRAYEMIHADDPGSCISRQFLYQQIKAGAIPYIAVGKKFYLDFDKLPDILDRLASDQASGNSTPSNIRRIGR